MASEVQICNRALQIVGAGRITSLDEENDKARECNAAYEPLRDAELEKSNWRFAMARERLSPETQSPAFGFSYQYRLPSNCIRPIPQEDQDDWEYEGRLILTDTGTLLDLIYLKQIEDPNLMSPMFREALAAQIGFAICEALTGSNKKKEAAERAYTKAISEAKLLNAIARPPSDESYGDWVDNR